LRAIGDVQWVGLDRSVREIVTKSVTKSGGKEYSVSERVTAIAVATGIDQEGLVALTDLLCKWRTSLVHSGARPSMTRETMRCLNSNKEAFATSYAAIDIVKTIQNFESGSTPTLKEVTTLVAANQNLAALIDQVLITRATPDHLAIQEIARQTLRTLLLDGGTPLPLMQNIWGTDMDTRARKLKSILINEGFVFVDDAATLSDELTTQVARMDKVAATKYLEK
jgi:hypothetical protein